MHTAYLITAYHQPRHLARLVEALTCDQARAFVHVDRKIDLAPFLAATKENRNITFLPDAQRVTCFWGGFGLVQASLNLMSAAVAAGAFHRFVLMTNSDFPIKRRDEREHELSDEREFIRVEKSVNTLARDHPHRRYLARFWFMNSPLLGRMHLSGKLPRRLHGGVRHYQGSSWWALTRGCVEYILHFTALDRGYVRFHRFTRVPDEFFFQTIVKRSPFAGNIVQDIENPARPASTWGWNEHAAHYIDWSPKTGRLPKVLGLEDLDALLRSRALFARKFEEGTSDALRAELETYLAG